MGPILKRERGIALLWALVIKDSQASVRIEESAQAYATAKSGIDWGIWYLNSQQSGVTFPITFNVGGPSQIVTVDISNIGATTVIESDGEVAGVVRRKLRYELRPIVNRAIRPSPGIPAGCRTTESFKIQFDFWMGSGGSAFTFGLMDSSSGNNLAMVVNNSNLARLVTTKPTSTSSSGTVQLSPSVMDPYRYRAEIKYIQNISATLEISQRNTTSGTEVFIPVGAQSISLVGVNLSNMNALYYPIIPSKYIINGVTIPPELAGDGEYLLINNDNYIDHISISGLSGCP
jgi:hypothetical protein